VNFAFPAIECAGVFDAFEEGDIAEVDFDAATVKNATSGKSFDAVALPPQLLALLKAGGIYSLLEKEGAIGPRTAASG
jgi:3-isopropylmalate/(R)-2-methylmalate dehydratase small subunit